jgi:pyridoxine kinase
MSILSIQSHVVYGYVGNKAAVYPLQKMGYDVWPINTVQFSNHTGYGTYEGEIFSREHIRKLVDGLEAIGALKGCKAVLSGYMGSGDICYEVANTVKRVKEQNQSAIYLCDPVIGNNSCYVKPEVLSYFKDNLCADIITPNHFEIEVLSGIKICNMKDLEEAAIKLHERGIPIVIVTGAEFIEGKLVNYVSSKSVSGYVKQDKVSHHVNINGTGDLFSALFLGYYLLTNDPLKSLRKASSGTMSAIKRTVLKNKRELQII